MRPSTSDEILIFTDLTDLAERISRKEVSPPEVVDMVLARIEKLNPRLNAYIRVIDEARQDARGAEAALRFGRNLGPLHGVPISVKDLMLTRGASTTAGSRVFGDGLVSNHDALLVSRLRRAGAILIGKTNLHEFAFGVTNDNAHFGPARNPWNLDRIPGGSSGGSAAAVAAGLCWATIGTDTRGSIRMPSAFCGITGLKPTRGLVPMKGVIPLSWTLDHAGPMTRSVRDAARMLQILTGRAPDHSGIPRQRVFESLRFGICDFYFRDLDPEVEQHVRNAVRVFQDSGAKIREIEIDHLDAVLDASDWISRAEAVAYHDRCLREQPENYGEAVRKRLLSGYELSGLDYVKAGRVRRRVIDAFKKAFRTVDCLIAPTLPVEAPPRGQDYVEIKGKKFPIVNALVRLNAPQNVAGIPALTLPCGFTKSGLPIGLQLIASLHHEQILFQAGNYFQAATTWHKRHPQLD